MRAIDSCAPVAVASCTPVAINYSCAPATSSIYHIPHGLFSDLVYETAQNISVHLLYSDQSIQAWIHPDSLRKVVHVQQSTGTAYGLQGAVHRLQHGLLPQHQVAPVVPHRRQGLLPHQQ
jgi:hypothetical protein